MLYPLAHSLAGVFLIYDYTTLVCNKENTAIYNTIIHIIPNNIHITFYTAKLNVWTLY